jgi:hypothetical protein
MARGVLVLGAFATLLAQTLAAANTDAAAPLEGSLRGVAVDAAGAPLAGIHVIMHSPDGSDERELLTAADGSFSASALKPGKYRLTVSKGGLETRTATVVAVAANETATANLKVAAASEAPATSREEELLARIERLEERLASMEGAGAPVEGAAPMAAKPGPAKAEAAPPPTTPLAAAAAPAPQGAPSAATPAPAPAPTLPEPLQAPDSTPGVDNVTPFAYGDFSWLNGSPRNNPVLDTKFFTPEIRVDTHFIEDFNQPKDHSMGGSTESFRNGEFQLEQISIGGDFHWQNVRGRILTMDGLFAVTTPRNDGSAGVGQWDVRGAYKYVSEAWGGYHFNVSHGLNVDAGIFVSYIGLFSYYNFDNWTYQPSYVSSNTPWFFNGLRIQWFPTNKLKIEPWIINGWQSYNKFNGHHGLGGQILYRPHEWLSFVFNNYGNGTDALGVPGRSRIHTDDSVEVRYFNKPDNKGISKMAFSLTGDLGCEYGAGVTCHGGKGGPKQAFLGWMLYDRTWFGKDKYALTFGGGMMNNPGRYLTLLPPINGADAISGTPYFTENPGDKAHMWDSSVNLQWMPKAYITWWAEAVYRHSDVPYWTGRDGITPPGGNNGSPTQYACMSGAASGATDLPTATAACGGPGSVWFPDLRRGQFTVSAGVLVKF